MPDDVGTFGRLGAWINHVDKGFAVADVTQSFAAEAADLKAGDVITHLDGKFAAYVTLSDARRRLRSATAPSTVRLSVHRAAGNAEIGVTVRDQIPQAELMPTRIEIIPAQTSWRSDFDALKAAVLRAAPRGSPVHHIGSTAIPGLASKDIIDIQLTVDSLASVDDSALEAEGFVRVRGLSDHCPPGMELAAGELRKRFYSSMGRAANLHVRESGRFNQRYALLCRDYLRTHPVAAGAYALIKERLARRAPEDSVAYYEIKDPVFDIIMAGANEWAERTGWCESASD